MRKELLLKALAICFSLPSSCADEDVSTSEIRSNLRTLGGSVPFAVLDPAPPPVAAPFAIAPFIFLEDVTPPAPGPSHAPVPHFGAPVTISPIAPELDTSAAPIPPSVTTPTICFSGDMTVFVRNKGSTPMRDLKLGDEIMVEHDTFEPIYSFGHFSHHAKGEFLRFRTHGRSDVLEISSDHMLSLASGRFVPASMVRVGDSLRMVSTGDSVEVSAIDTVIRKGLYAPFTMSGTLVVNDIKASSFVSFQGSDVFVIGDYRTYLSYQWLAQTSQVPHRLAYRFGWVTEEYTNTGISVWVNQPLMYMRWWLGQPSAMVLLLLPPVLVVLLMLAITEALLRNYIVIGVLALAYLVKRNSVISVSKQAACHN